MGHLTQGLVQVYTGPGKGKTTAALGLALRAVGHGLRVCFVQFMKEEGSTGERAAAQRLHPELEIHVFSAPHWGDRSQASEDTPWWNLPPSAEDKKQAGEGLLFAQRALAGGAYDLVVLDEVLVALKFELVSLDDVLGLIRAKPPTVELVLTGRDAPAEVIESADLVTEMNAVKHPFDQGLEARKGIEY